MKEYQIHEACCNFGLSNLLKCGISNTLATPLLTKRFVGPGTFQAGLEVYEVAGPAGLYLIKLKVGHCPLASSLSQLVCFTSLMASLIRCVGGLSKCFYQGL